MKRLGAVVVHADFNRVILCTKKRSLADALAYVEYVTNTIHNKELFHSIDMRFLKAWDYLLWCDPSNFGGIKSKMSPSMSEKAKKGKKSAEGGDEDDDEGDDEAEEDGTEFSDGEDEDDDDGPDIEMNWNLASYLPEEGACQKNFNTVIAGYVMAIHQFLQDEAERVVPGSTPVRRRRNASQTQSSQRRREGVGEGGPTVEEYARELVSGELAQRLFAITEKIHKKMPEQLGDLSHSAFPALPGSHLRLTNPALEFVKALHKVSFYHIFFVS